MAVKGKRIITFSCGNERAEISSNLDSQLSYFTNRLCTHGFKKISEDSYETESMGSYLNCVREASNMGLLI